MLQLRKQKSDAEKQNNKEKIAVTAVEPEGFTKSPEYTPRGKYSARNIKSTLSPAATTASSISSSDRPAFKYSRKFKYTSTTQAPNVVKDDANKKVEADAPFKKSLIRPSLISRKLTSRTFLTSTEVSVVTEVAKRQDSNIRNKVSLPRTSYYSRLRNSKNTTTTSTTTEKNEKVSQDTVHKTDDPDMPLIFTLLKEPDHNNLVSDSLIKHNENQQPFIITISSTESVESMTANEVFNALVDINNAPITTETPTIPVGVKEGDKHKYHSNYKNQNPVAEEKARLSSTTAAPIRNTQSRKYGKARSRKDKVEDSANPTTARSRERIIKKYSEASSKTTEASNNGVSIIYPQKPYNVEKCFFVSDTLIFMILIKILQITPEPEKSKSRYSSKYRASYLDKPFYKPTVPSITSSTVSNTTNSVYIN